MLPEEHETQRANEDRRAGYCGAHLLWKDEIKEMSSKLDRTGDTVAKQAGMWVVLFLVAGSFAGTFFYITNQQTARYEKAQAALFAELKATNASLNNIDKVVINYMAGHVEESKRGFEFISSNTAATKQNSADIKRNTAAIERLQHEVETLERFHLGLNN